LKNHSPSLGKFLRSPWAVLLPFIAYTLIFVLLLFVQQVNFNQLSTTITLITTTQLAILIVICLLHYYFVINVRRSVQNLIDSRDSNIELARQKTDILREEIRQHKAARSELQRLATHDQLTGARNRRHFKDTLSSEIERYKRYRNNFSLLIIDLDHFQKINDAHGHDCGDYVLQQFAQYVQENLRQSDVFVRYGGQEFAIIATNTEVDSAKRFADKLCSNIENYPIKYQTSMVNITISIGIGAPESLKTLSEQNLVNATESALRTAKSQGRNRAICTSITA